MNSSAQLKQECEGTVPKSRVLVLHGKNISTTLHRSFANSLFNQAMDNQERHFKLELGFLALFSTELVLGASSLFMRRHTIKLLLQK
jgi:hypothetical protein